MKCKAYYEKQAGAEYALYVEAKNSGESEGQKKHYAERVNYKESTK